MAGWVAPLDEVPDAVFAERMLGDGLAIDPVEGLLRAPCKAEIISIPASGHAVTLRLANGAELLIHIGLETVGLGGEGFTACVSSGQQVNPGDPLIAFDLDRVGRRAKSLISPIVLTGEGFVLAPLALGRSVVAGEPIAEVRGEAGVAPEAEGAPEAAGVELAIKAPHGIHARPAARIASAAKAHSASVELVAAGGRANARSPVAIMALGLRSGDSLTVEARGADAGAAVAAVVALIEAGFDEAPETGPAPPVAPPPRSGPPGAIGGVCAAPGLAIGPAAPIMLRAPEVREQGRDTAAEREALAVARAAVADRLVRFGADMDGIALAHRSLLDDPELIAAADAEIESGRSAGFAWRAATAAAAARLHATGDSRLVGRIDDLRDIERQLLVQLAGESEESVVDLPDGAILIADTLLPSQLMALDLGRVGGIATAQGGPTSHAAIIAAAAGVPMLVAAGDRLLAIPAGAGLILDAAGGWVLADPAPEALADARQRIESERRTKAAHAAVAGADCRMADGTRIEIFANLASADEARRAVAAGAEGCGLLRTEFLFHDRTEAPDEEEQRAAYAAVARALDGRPLIIRTLDSGGDKPLAYLALPIEENPALGLRGVRLGLMRPDLLAVQLRAILRAGAEGDLRIMVPMIVDVGEYRAVRAAMDRAAAETGAAPLPLGVMVETPAAALLADSLAAEADFLSVGTNDLSQYALAADRGNAATADRLDALHPAVLRLIAAAGEGARRRGKWLGICGGVASDPLASAILIGLGAAELSATPAAIPALKAAVRQLRIDDCRAVAARALAAQSAQEVRTLAAEALAPALRGAA